MCPCHRVTFSPGPPSSDCSLFHVCESTSPLAREHRDRENGPRGSLGPGRNPQVPPQAAGLTGISPIFNPTCLHSPLSRLSLFYQLLSTRRTTSSPRLACDSFRFSAECPIMSWETRQSQANLDVGHPGSRTSQMTFFKSCNISPLVARQPPCLPSWSRSCSP